jgi:hypothetical protein
MAKWAVKALGGKLKSGKKEKGRGEEKKEKGGGGGKGPPKIGHFISFAQPFLLRHSLHRRPFLSTRAHTPTRNIPHG